MNKINIDLSKFTKEQQFRISYVAIYNKKQDFINIVAKSESEAWALASNEIKRKHRIKSFIIKNCEPIILLKIK